MPAASGSDDSRSRILTAALTVLSASVFLFVMFFACGGLLVYIVAVLLVMAAIAGLQYLLWGRALTASAMREEAASQQQALEANDISLDREEARDWTPEERTWYQRF